MPELPEVETVVRELNDEICGDSITSVEIFRSNPIVQGDLEAFQNQLIGRSFKYVTRRAKYIVFHLIPSGHMVAHLRMTGKFIVCGSIDVPTKYHRVWFHLNSGKMMIFDDVRCFGTLEFYKKLSDSKALNKLGIEPFSENLTVNYFKSKVASSKREIKSILLDQQIIAGLGNIYVSEILFHSRISPIRITETISQKEWAEIIKYTKSVLKDAIENNGTTISDFRRVDDKTGKFQQFLKVYDKKDQPCTNCGILIQRIIQQQRSTFFCPECQH